MSQAGRVSRILTLLRAHRRGIPTHKLLKQLAVSRATLFRDMAVLRDQMGQPVVFDKNALVAEGTQGGWRLENNPDSRFVRDELPGVWITPSEGYAILTLYNVLRRIDPGFLAEYITPLRPLLKRVVGRSIPSTSGLGRKVGIELGEFEPINSVLFARISQALVSDKRLTLTFSDEPGRKERTSEVSPQRIVLTAEGWNLDVFDHRRKGPRSIALSAIRRAVVLKASAELYPAFTLTGAPDTSHRGG